MGNDASREHPQKKKEKPTKIGSQDKVMDFNTQPTWYKTDDEIQSDPTSISVSNEVTHLEGENVDKDHVAEVSAPLIDLDWSQDTVAGALPPHITVTPSTPDNADPPGVENFEEDQSACELKFLFQSDEEKDEDDKDLSLSDKEEEEGKNVSKIPHFTAREVHTGKVLGEGGFGRVLKGSLHGSIPVVIKLFHAPLVLQSDQEEDEFNTLLRIKNPHICKVIGIIPQTEQVDCPQLVLQYFTDGNVLQYLSRPENPQDLNVVGKLCLDIVEGCRYLQNRRIVNGNLAARNVLVARVVAREKTYFNAKLADVGLIRFAEASGGNYFKLPGTNRTVPVRWVPREILDDASGPEGGEFTFQSDVWSFGVCLWEIFTRGAIPYGASYSNLKVVQFIMEGYSPLKVHKLSELAPEMVTLLESIFKVDPEERPTFNCIHEYFKDYKGYGQINSKAKTRPAKDKAQMEGSAGLSGVAMNPVHVKDSPLAVTHEDSKKTISSMPSKKKVKKHFPGNEPGLNPDSVPELTGPDGARALPVKTKHKVDRTKAVTETKDGQIAALLRRVDQLEKERFGGKRGGGNSRGRGNTFHAPKRRGSPRFHQPHVHVDSVSSMNPMVNDDIGGPPPPPPYSEEPLPHHSRSQFSGPLPEYHIETRSRGRSRGGFPGSSHQIERGSSRPSIAQPMASSSSVIEDDFIQKIKRLAEEIEVLRAEKMTQELLKKSAELADLMKSMSTGRDGDDRHVGYTAQRGSRGIPSIPPQHSSFGTVGYYEHEYENDNQDYRSQPPFFNSRRGNRGHGSPRRPYKSRGSGNARYPGFFDRYDDRDGPYGA